MRLLKDEVMQSSVEGFSTEEEMKLRAIFASSPDAITVSDLNGNIIECNPATLDALGFPSKDEIIGKSAFKFIAKKDRKRAMENLKKTLEQGSVRNIEYTCLTKDGREFPAELSASVIKDPSGNPTGFVAITKEVTELKKAEEEMIRLSSAVKMSTDSIVISDMDGKIIDVNEATLKMYGTNDKRNLIGKNSFDLIAPEDREKAFAGMKKVLEKGYIKRREYNIITKDGGRIPVEMSVAVMKDAGGEPIGFVGISRDITERKKAEEELMKSEMRYRNLVENAGAGIVTTDWRGRCTFANKALCKMMGYSEKELMGKHFADFLHPDDKKRILPLFWNAFRRPKRELYLEFRVIHKKGHVVHMYSNPTLFRYKNKILGFNAVISDITERKQMEGRVVEYAEHLEEMAEERTRELREAQENLIKSERLAAIGEAASMVGHDLRNPLQSIENATYYLNNELPRLPPYTPIPQKAIEMLQIINDSVNYADKIIRNLHDFAATKKLILKKTNINTIVKETLSQVKASENVELITELGHLPRIEADKDMIKRAFLNLAINGIQAMENGGRLKVSTKKTRGFVEVSFKDTGIGMPKENMKKIFTPFFTTKAKGIGMGLPICKKFVESHGGSIEAESEEGKGSTFTVKLPIK